MNEGLAISITEASLVGDFTETTPMFLQAMTKLQAKGFPLGMTQ